MKTMYLFLVISAFTSLGYSQSISQFVIGNAGTALTGSSNTVSFTVGEPIVGFISTGPSLGQGFWLGTMEGVVLESEDFSKTIGITVFPNPVEDILQLSFTDLTNEDFSLQMVDLMGRVVLQKKLSNVMNKEELYLGFLSRGTYLLTLQRKLNQQAKTIKIIKK